MIPGPPCASPSPWGAVAPCRQALAQRAWSLAHADRSCRTGARGGEKRQLATSLSHKPAVHTRGSKGSAVSVCAGRAVGWGILRRKRNASSRRCLRQGKESKTAPREGDRQCVLCVVWAALIWHGGQVGQRAGVKLAYRSRRCSCHAAERQPSVQGLTTTCLPARRSFVESHRCSRVTSWCG